MAMSNEEVKKHTDSMIYYLREIDASFTDSWTILTYAAQRIAIMAGKSDSQISDAYRHLATITENPVALN